jgi:hypothetical protein
MPEKIDSLTVKWVHFPVWTAVEPVRPSRFPGARPAVPVIGSTRLELTETPKECRPRGPCHTLWTGSNARPLWPVPSNHCTGSPTVASDTSTRSSPNLPGKSRASLTARRALGPLFAYHAIIIVGAIVLLLGIARSEALWVDTGSVVVAAGIAVYLAVVAWTIQLARRSARPTGNSSASTPQSVLPDPRGRSLCPSCGWKGDRESGICPRCGKLLVTIAQPTP